MDSDYLHLDEEEVPTEIEESPEVYLTPPPDDDDQISTQHNNEESNIVPIRLFPPEDVSNSIRTINSPINRYLRSSSASRNLKKLDDCKFCHMNVDGPGVKHHLNISKKCRIFYLRLFKVKSLDQLFLKLFSCLCCKERKRICLKRHLQRSEPCILHYRNELGINDIDKIIAEVEKLKRKTYPSRMPSVRSLQYNNRKEEELRTKTCVSSINDFNDKVAFGNYRLCVKCLSNFREHEARAVREDEELFETMKLATFNAKAFRRFESFFICNSCSKESGEECGNKEDPPLYFGDCVDNDALLIFPMKEFNPENVDGEVLTNKIKVLFPNSIDSVQEFTVKRSGSNHAEIRKIYRASKVERTTIKSLYVNELQKYKQAEENSSLYTAKIQNIEEKTIASVEKMSNCSRITGSDEWFDLHVKRMKNWQEQCGLIHVTIEIQLPPTSSEVIATCLVQNGTPVTLSKCSLGSGELLCTYMVHTNHNNQEDCPDNCIQVSMEEYLENNDFDHVEVGNKYVGTYVSSCHQKLQAFCKYILEAPDSGFHTQNFKLFLVFDTNGIGSIVGSFWPDNFNEVNIDAAQHFGEVTKKEELINVVNKNVCCTGNVELLRNKLGISKEEANVISSLVIENQLQLKGDGQDCSVIGMPSLETLLIESCSSSNLIASKRFLDLIKKFLGRMDYNEKKRKRTTSFLEEVWGKSEGYISDDFKSIEINIEDEDLVKFYIDERFTDFLDKYADSPLTAAYHYALTCCGNEDHSTMVLERLWIIDCYVLPFNSMFLKVIPSGQVHVVNSTALFESFFLDNRPVTVTDEKFDSRTLLSHRFISLQEAISLSDSSIKRVNSSSKEVFVNAKPNRNLVFRKSNKIDEQNFKMIGSREQFELLGSIITRHFTRYNIEEKILLSETAVWYDFIGKERSREVSETYRNLEIPRSDDDSIYGFKLPQFILCSNGDVLKKRKRKNIIILPNCWSDYNVMYQKCLLFFPIKSENELVHGNIRNMYEQYDKETMERIVHINERKVFQTLIRKPDYVDITDGDSSDTDLDALLNALSDVED